MTTAKNVMDVLARFSDYDKEAAGAVSVNNQIYVEDAPTDVWIRLPRHKWSKSWTNMKDSVLSPKRNLYGHLFAGPL